jgi:hypothetical protein
MPSAKKKAVKPKFPMSDEDYAVRNLGLACPFCGETKVESLDDIRLDDGYAWQECTCGACHKNWTDSYRLVGYCEVST